MTQDSMRQRLWFAIGQAVAEQYGDEVPAPVVVLTPLVNAVLAALAEPTEAMIAMGDDMFDAGAETPAVWQAMIAEASKP